METRGGQDSVEQYNMRLPPLERVLERAQAESLLNAAFLKIAREEPGQPWRVLKTKRMTDGGPRRQRILTACDKYPVPTHGNAPAE